MFIFIFLFLLDSGQDSSLESEDDVNSDSSVKENAARVRLDDYYSFVTEKENIK